MLERHELEQYFWEEETLGHLAEFTARYPNPCCLCAPMLGTELERRGVTVRTLDTDERFATLAGFRQWDVYRPLWTGEEYGLILCDPPFFNVSLSQLFTALRLLARHDYAQPILLAYLARRASAVTGAFAPFGLEDTGYHPGYRTVQAVTRNEITLFGNLGAEAHAALASRR